MHKQVSKCINQFLSPYLCGYRQGFSTRQALVSLTEKWKAILDRNGYAGAVLMDLSKAFDTINYDFLTAKLNAYGFTKNSLRLIKSDLSNPWQRTKINAGFSSQAELLLVVPQGSVLGPLLFNIYIKDLLFLTESTNVCNNVDHTIFHACYIDLENLARRLEHDSMLAIEWFESNYMKLIQDTHPAFAVVATSHLGLIQVGTWQIMLRRHHDLATATSMKRTYLRRLCEISLVSK